MSEVLLTDPQCRYIRALIIGVDRPVDIDLETWSRLVLGRKQSVKPYVLATLAEHFDRDLIDHLEQFSDTDFLGEARRCRDIFFREEAHISN